MMKIKQIIFTFLFLIFLSGISYSQITLTLPKVSGAPGTSVVSPINVSDLTGLGVTSFQFELKYDPNIIIISGVSTAGTLISSPTVAPDTANGKLRVAWASAGSLSGSGTLLNINIQFKNVGTTSIKYMVSDSLNPTFTFYSQFGSNLTVNAADGSAQTSTGSIPPSLNMNPTGPYTIGEGSTLTATLIGSDTKPGAVLTYSYTSTPAITGATLNTTTGAFSWTPVTNQFGLYNVVFSVSDGTLKTSISTTITVTKTNLPPTLSLNPTGPYTVNEGSTLTVNLIGNDINLGDVLTYSFTSNPQMTGAVVNPSSGVFTWTPTTNQAGIYNVTFSVNDGKVTTSVPTTITVTSITNTPPTLTLNPAGPFSVNAGATLTINLIGNDINIGDVLTYSFISNPQMTGAVVNPSSGVFTWTPTAAQEGNYAVTFTVSDGKATTQVLTIITVVKVNLPPTLSLVPAGPYIVNEGQKLTVTLQGSDPNSGDVLTYSITNPATLPAGVQLTGNQFTWIPNYNQGSTTPYNFTFKVTDQGGLSASQSTSIYVNKVNRAPVFTKEIPDNLILTVNIPVPLNFTFQYAAVDPDSDKVTFSLITGPDGSSVTSAGLFSWAPTVSQAEKSYTLTIQASDGILFVQSTHIISAGKVVGVQKISEIPTNYELYQNYPNPFNPTTSIRFAVPKESPIKISLFNLLGQKIGVLVNKIYSPGIYRVSFDASKLNSGIYLYKIESNNFVSTKKMMVLK
jgi:hypothetical protein